MTLSLTVCASDEKVPLEMLAAMLTPSLRRARVSANEAATIGDTRAVIGAENTYQAVGHGYAGLACLANPVSCVNGYAGPVLLPKGLVDTTRKSGYERTFHPGPPGVSPGTYRTFAYTATPIEPGKTGIRSFCGDSTGRMYFEPTGAAIMPKDGECPTTCTYLLTVGSKVAEQ